MRYLDEYRDPHLVKQYLLELEKVVTQPWTIMEICGGQTHSLVKNGLLEMLPAGITMVHGPGCPVCVTPISIIDEAIYLAQQPAVILCSFGDMLRVPLTTVSWSTAAMGQAAAQLLLELIDGDNNAPKFRTVTIPPELLIRRSCGALKQQNS